MMESISNASKESAAKERQDNELLSIASIFSNEVKDLRKNDVWKTWRPLELLITLTPEESMTTDKDINTEADLYVKCAAEYPNALPFIDIKHSKGLSNQDITELKQKLREVANQNYGNEMILELIYYTRTYLRNHTKPQHKSFYDEMLFNQQRQEKEMAEKLKIEKEAKQLEEEKKLLAIEQERHRKKEALKDANRRSKFPESTQSEDLMNSVESSFPKSSLGIRQRTSSESSCKEVCTGTIKKTMKFCGKKEFNIFCGQCLNHNVRGCVIYHGMDMTTGVPGAVIKWTLQWKKTEALESVKEEQANYMKQLTSIEQEFKTLRQLNHQGIVHYLGMNYIQEKYKITIYILQEYVLNCTLAKFSKGIPLSVQQLQVYTRGILEALKYLHENSVVHKNIRDTSVFIDSNGLIKLSDYSLDKRLNDLYRSFTNEAEIDLYPPTIGKGGKKGDVYRLGIILLSLSIGNPIKDIVPKIPQFLNPTLRDFLNKCLINDERERWSADQLLSHPFLAFSSLCGLLCKDYEDRDVEKEEELTEIPGFNNDGSTGSRLLSEFDLLKWLGKGGFGCVLKVKNKLDSRVYALKRIRLNPSKRQLDRKIKREVKLLSRLNHENIVRYYNSWIEETSAANDLNSDAVKSTSSSKADAEYQTSKETEQSAASVQWDMHDNEEDGFSLDDEGDDSTSLILTQEESTSSDSIVFQNDDDDDQNIEISSAKKRSANQPISELNGNTKSQPKIHRFMYIQMEFCEKSTLRTAIDNKLYTDSTLVWRLFREIVEGLHHIHQQGVIHRDLKPVNIFLDSKDHVKIGDFGLATDVVSKPVLIDISASGDTTIVDQNTSRSDAVEDGTRTGNIGTTFYVAPEVASTVVKLSYNQKVDIYSLGIIFFEMCYPTPVTAMERANLLMNLRKPDIVLPTDIEKHLTKEMVHIINWLLQHNPTLRPTSAELSASDCIPPLLMEETELNSVLCKTVSIPQSRTYKYMINALFNQEVTAKFDFTYDMDTHKGQLARNKPTQIFSDVVDTLNKIMRKHGAVICSVPTLMPKSPMYENEASVRVMDHGGGIVNLPHNLRVPFARHIGRSEINQLKRFTLEKVYREQKVFGCHPREQYEYAFDIISPTSCSFVPDAEVIYAVSEIISEFPSLVARNYYIRLNHVALLKAIFLYSGVEETRESEVYKILGDKKNRNASKLHLQNQLTDLKLAENTVSKLCHFIEVEDNIEKIFTLFQQLTQMRGDVGKLTKKALGELKTIVKLSETFGVNMPIMICPALAHEVKLFSGMIFQYVHHLKMKKKKDILDILAAGGRYDQLISSFKFKNLSDGSRGINQSGVGVSIAVERIIAAELESDDDQTIGVVDVLVYGADPEMHESKANLLRELWSRGISATMMYDKQLSLDDAVDFSRENNISHILILSKSEPGVIKIRFVEKDKVNEKKICYSDINNEFFSKFSSKSAIDSSQVTKTDYTKSNVIHNSSTGPSYSVKFLPQDRTHSNRKREPNIRSLVSSTLLPCISSSWEIIAVELKMSIVGTIVGNCDINSSAESISKSLHSIADEHPPKLKKYLQQLSDEICDIKTKKNNSIILYSLPDNNFRVLL